MLLPATTYAVTHTVHNRQFLLTPSPVVNQVVLYRKRPGVCSRPDDWRKPVRHVERSRYFFSQHDPNWASVPGQFTVPL